MDTSSGFAMGELHRNDPLMVFDWDKAAQILVDRKPERALAGLTNDFEWTGGIIWKDGKPFTDDYTYLASTWAEPLLVIDAEEIKCWRYESEVPDWGSGTKWPQSALRIVGKEK